MTVLDEYWVHKSAVCHRIDTGRETVWMLPLIGAGDLVAIMGCSHDGGTPKLLGFAENEHDGEQKVLDMLVQDRRERGDDPD